MKRMIKLWGVNIELCDDVYEPHDDTDLLISTILENEKEMHGYDVLEIGSGTGLISIVLAKKEANVTAIDISMDAINCTKKNMKINNVNIEVLHGNLFEPVGNKRFDLIVFNPPYLPEDSLDKYLSDPYKQAIVGGKKGNEVIIEFLKKLPSHLREHGKAYFVVSSLSGINDIMTIAQDNKLILIPQKEAKYFFETLIVYKVIVKKE